MSNAEVGERVEYAIMSPTGMYRTGLNGWSDDPADAARWTERRLAEGWKADLEDKLRKAGGAGEFKIVHRKITTITEPWSEGTRVY